MRAEDFEPLSPEVAQRWAKFGQWEDRVLFPSIVGLRVDELREDYCRMRLPYRPELNQPFGVVHGGAIATLIDSVVVPAIGAAYGPDIQYVTVNMNINYTGAVVETDAVAEGWVTRRGRSTVFCRAEVFAGERLAAEASLVYAIRRLS